MPVLIALLVAMLGFLSARDAAAEERYGVVTLDLLVEGADVPTHLCVVSEAQSARTRQKLRDVLEKEPEKGGNGDAGAASWRVKPETWNGDAQSADRQRCADSAVGDCRPRVQLPEALAQKSDLFVACTADSLSTAVGAGDPRPLFILLEHLEGSPPEIDSVRLTGGVATIGVKANLAHVVVTARSLGGAYLPHKRSERAEAEPGRAELGGKSVQVNLDLVPRCRVIEVTLPRTRVGPGDRDRLEVRTHGVSLDVDKCVGNLVGTDVLQVRVPQAPLGVGTIDVELAATADAAGAQFGGRWDGPWPKTPFELELNQVSFTWKRPECIYPHSECPTATLGTGTTCAATATKTGCQYRCPGEVDDNAIDLPFPLEVTFEKKQPRQSWTDTLAQNGQELTSYVESKEIYLNANINDWETDLPDNRISNVEIHGEDGAVHKYGVTHVPNLLIKVPGATCEPVRFRIKGDRSYEERVADVRDGKLEFGKPYRAARLVAINVTLLAGGGPAWSTLNDNTTQPPLYFSGLGMFALEFRPRKPKASRLGIELRFGGTLGRYAITSFERASDDPNSMDYNTIDSLSTEPAGWARVLFEPGLVVSAHQRIAVGMGFGLGFSLPFRQRDQILADGLRFIYSPNLDLRFRVQRWLKLVLQFRGILHEQPFVQGSLDSTQEPGTVGELRANGSGAFLTLFGAQVSF